MPLSIKTHHAYLENADWFNTIDHSAAYNSNYRQNGIERTSPKTLGEILSMHISQRAPSWQPGLASGILMLVLIAWCPALAARFPNAVEKKVILSGAAAQPVAQLFGLNGLKSGSVSLPLGRMDAWAVYLLKKDTKVELIYDNDGSPPRVNVLDFSTNPTPSLTIQPYWLDLATRLPSPSAGDYSFSSPFVSEKLDQSDSWTQLIKDLKGQPNWKGSERVPYERSFPFAGGSTLIIEVFADEDYANHKHGYAARITVHLRT
jgi:hypothetical protein